MNALQEHKETVDQPTKMSPCEKHYFNQDNESRLTILRAMAIGLIPTVAQTAPLAHGHGQHTGIPTKHFKTEASDTQQPNKQHLINEIERRCRTMMLRLNGDGDKPKSAWSVDQITHWLEENPVQNESCVYFIRSTLRDADGSEGIPFDTPSLADSSNHEGGVKAAKAAASSEELSSERVKDQLSRWQQQDHNLGMVNSNDHVIKNESMTSSAAANERSIPSEAVVEEATTRVAVAGNGAGRQREEEEEEEAARRARLQEERSRLLTRSVGLPGFSVERTLELQERLGVVPSNEMLFEEVKRRLAGMSRREILIKWLMDNPIEELEEISNEMQQYQETIDRIQNNINNQTQNQQQQQQQQQQPRTLGSMVQPAQNLADAAQQEQEQQHPQQAPSDNRFLQMEANPPLIFDHLLADLPETEGTPEDDVVVVLDDTSTTLLTTESDIEDEYDEDDDEEEFSNEHHGDLEPNDERTRHDPDGNQAVGSHESGLAETGHWNAPTTTGTTAQDRATSDGDTGNNLSTIDTSLTKMTMEE